MDSKTYKVVGISTTPAGITKVRFAQDLVSRIKTLVMRGHTDVKLLETPQAMNKQGCLTWLKSQPGFDTPQVKLLADQFLTRNHQETATAPMATSAR